MKISTYFPVLLVIVALQSCNQSQNWNQYLGPNRNATIQDATILPSWEDSQPVELWSQPLGEGYGGASIFEDEVFILDRVKGESDILRCFDLLSGEESWSYSYQAPGEISYPGSRAVPTVSEKCIWSVGPQGDVYCFDKESRSPVWNFNVKDSYHSRIPYFGNSQSPVIFGDLMIISLASEKAGLAAFDKLSGELVWESRAYTGITTHVSPMLANFGGVDQVIIYSPSDRKDSTMIAEVVSFDVNTGEELWRYDGMQSHASLASPVQIGESRLFVTDCSYNGKFDPVSVLLEIDYAEDSFSVEEIFLTEEAGCKMHPGVYYDNHIFLHNNGRPTTMQCLDLSGKAVWEGDSIPGFELGGYILIDDKIIIQNGKNGDIHLLEANPEAYVELGKASYFSAKKSQAWAPLAFSQGKLIIRNLQKMVCVDLNDLE